MALRGGCSSDEAIPAQRGDCFAIARNDRCVMVNEMRRLHTLTGTRAKSQVELDALLPSVLDRAFKGEL